VCVESRFPNRVRRLESERSAASVDQPPTHHSQDEPHNYLWMNAGTIRSLLTGSLGGIYADAGRTGMAPLSDRWEGGAMAR
jgi:hypothetical protein